MKNGNKKRKRKRRLRRKPLDKIVDSKYHTHKKLVIAFIYGNRIPEIISDQLWEDIIAKHISKGRYN